MTDIKLTAQTVTDTLKACLLTPEEAETLDRAKLIELGGRHRVNESGDDLARLVHPFWCQRGVRLQVVLSPTRLLEHQDTVKALLDCLPIEVLGWASFTRLCVDRDGRRWGEHSNMDELLTLGLALGMVRFSPRDLWDLMYAVPYVNYTPPLKWVCADCFEAAAESDKPCTSCGSIRIVLRSMAEEACEVPLHIEAEWQRLGVR